MPTSSREVRVEVQSRLNGGASRRLIRVAGQEVENVVATTVTSLDDQAEIRGQSTTIGSTSGLLVLISGWDIIGELSRAFLDFTLIIGFSVVLVFFGEGSHLISGVRDTNERTPWHTGQRVAAGADLTVDLETTAKAARGINKSMSKTYHPKTRDAWHSRLVVKCLGPLLVLPGVLGRVQSAG